jgi:prepilin-type N-terminal cleavage/methylation domain-containing protein
VRIELVTEPITDLFSTIVRQPIFQSTTAAWRASNMRSQPTSNQSSSNRSSHRPAHRRGLSLVEVMISTAISATLLTAAAAAWSASSKATQINDQVFRSAQAARVSMLLMTNEIRRCQAISNFTGSQDHIDLITYDNHAYTYKFNAPTKQLLLIDTGVTPNATHKLADNVTFCSFSADNAPNPQTQIQCVTRIAINLNVTVSGNPVFLAGSACPRVNLNY